MPVPDKQPLHRYNHLVSEIEAVYHEISLRLGVSDSTMIVLYTICDQGGSCLLQDICRYSGLSRQTLNSALRRMEEQGLLYLMPVDQKSKRACLTKTGDALAQRTALRLMQAENAIFSSWAPEDVERYLELTGRFLQGLREKARELAGDARQQENKKGEV